MTRKQKRVLAAIGAYLGIASMGAAADPHHFVRTFFAVLGMLIGGSLIATLVCYAGGLLE